MLVYAEHSVIGPNGRTVLSAFIGPSGLELTEPDGQEQDRGTLSLSR